MKQFSLDEYLKDPSRKVVTRDGRPVRIVCTDRKEGVGGRRQRGIHHRVGQEDNVGIDMETKFNFNSQICTNKIQSIRLLALGLKKETADMYRTPSWGGVPSKIIGYYCPNVVCFDDHFDVEPNDLPAWSLGRLIKLMPRTAIMHTQEGDTSIDIDMYAIEILVSDDPIAEAVSVIEWLIKEGSFNKEYLKK